MYYVVRKVKNLIYIKQLKRHIGLHKEDLLNRGDSLLLERHPATAHCRDPEESLEVHHI